MRSLKLHAKLPPFMLLGVLVGFICFYFLTSVTQLGHNIPSTAISFDFTVGLIWAIFIELSIFFWPVSQKDKKILLILWMGRCLVTLGVMLLYEDNYGLDAYTYFSESHETFYNLENVGFGKGTGNLGFMVWWINNFLPVFGSYHAIKVIFSLIGLLSVFIFYRGIVCYSGEERPKLLLVCGLFPSLVFWSSILGKDPLVLFGICLYSWGMLGWIRNHMNVAYIMGVFFGVLISSAIRPWTGLILLIPAALNFIFSSRGFFLRWIYLGLLSLGVSQIFTIFSSQFNVVGVDDLVTKTNAISKAWSFGGSSQMAPDFKSIPDMLSFAPLGMFTALFRPLPGEILNLFGTMAGLENLFLCILLFLSIKRLSWQKLKDPAIFWALSLIVVWSLVYGFVSYQNLGSAFRFRLQVLPILLVTLLSLSKVSTQKGRNESLEVLQG